MHNDLTEKENRPMIRLLNISQLARLSSRSRNTIKAMLSDGRISAETAPDGKRGVSVAEACRVFNLDADCIERELAGEVVKPAQEVATGHKPDGQAGSASSDQSVKIAMLQAEIEHLRQINAMLSEMVNVLKADKETLSEMVREHTRAIGQFSRLIPQKSSAGRSQQARDSNGRFTGTGRGVGALLEQADLLQGGGK